jgi:hypothetical protein
MPQNIITYVMIEFKYKKYTDLALFYIKIQGTLP